MSIAEPVVPAAAISPASRARRLGAPGRWEEPPAHAPAGHIRLLELYPDGAGRPPKTGAPGSPVTAPLVYVPAGPCELSACAAAVPTRGQLLAAVVVEGLLIGTSRLAGQVSMDLYGPGDLLAGEHEQNGSLPTVDGLIAPARVTLAMLDDRFLESMRRSPGIAQAFFTQTMLQVDRAAQHRSINQLTRVEDRLLALLWHLADRWGRVRPDGVLLDLGLTHETIGHLIGARRPTVTLGVRTLTQQGLLDREPDGRWRLPAESLDWLSNGGAAAGPARLSGTAA